VQTFLFHANVLGAAAARRAGAPHVLAGIRVADPRRWRAWLERWACRRVERFVCVSERVAEHCRAWGYPADKLTVIHNGIDWRRYAEAVPIALPQLGLPAGRRAIVFVGRLDPQKGLDDFLEMCPVIFRELPDHDLVLVGDGPRRHELACRARHLDIASRVHFTGWRSDVPEILAAAEMLVLPSRWEGMPNVVLEAMAAGKPVVATRVAGVEEALGELAEVQCVVPGDQRGFAGRICHFVRHPQEAQKVGQNNQRRVAEAFSVDAVADSYQALYWAILTSQAGGTFSD
jgi:glycosyltransferase involved in cell wall biosynthesis